MGLAEAMTAKCLGQIIIAMQGNASAKKEWTLAKRFQARMGAIMASHIAQEHALTQKEDAGRQLNMSILMENRLFLTACAHAHAES